jgi:hypothetical protein
MSSAGSAFDHPPPPVLQPALSLAKTAYALAASLERLALRRARISWEIDRKGWRSADDLSRRARNIAQRLEALDPNDQRARSELAKKLTSLQDEARSIAPWETN